MTTKALNSPIIVLNSFGFSGAENLATYLAAHKRIGLLPGQNFIQQKHALYRPLTLPEDDAQACFTLLATKQYTKGGVQWAGLGKYMSAEYAARYSTDHHRKLFVLAYSQLPTECKSQLTQCAKLYTHTFFESIGDDTSELLHYGFYGSNLLLNASAYPDFHNDTLVLQVMPTPAQWLSLASQARTWNPEAALNFYIIQNLIITKAKRTQNNIHCVDFEALITDTENTLNRCCDFLSIAAWDSQTPIDGQGHVPATKAFFDKIFDDADKVCNIYKGSQLFEMAACIEDWCDSFFNDKPSMALLVQYQAYWNSTSHIAFDWSGPLEVQLKACILHHAEKAAKIKQVRTDSVPYQFYQQWYTLSSIDHGDVQGDACYPLGCLETQIPLPKLQYFMRIAIHYLQTSIQLQQDKLHSYHCARESSLYKRLCEAEYQQAIDRNWLREAFTKLEHTITATERAFQELADVGTSIATTSSNAQIKSIRTSSTSTHFESIIASIQNKQDRTQYGLSDKDISAIAVSGPDITEHENKMVACAMNDWYEQPYYFCEKFEQRFAQFHNRKFALMTPNCTSANQLLLLGLGIGKGDEVLVPECTWIASATPAYHTGATPIFCDIDEDDWCISLDSIKENITHNTRAIVVVNVYGNMAKMEALEQFAKQHNLYLIEDAAESIGSVYKGRRSGEFGVGSLFSFHRTKTLTTGEGGMLLIDDEDLYKRCTKIRDHGRGPDTPAFTHDIIAHKFMPFNVQAALGLAQFERLDQLVNKKRHILNFYKERLARFDGIQFNQENNDVYNSAWCSTIVLGDEFSHTKQSLMVALDHVKVPTRPFFYPLSSQPGIKVTLAADVDMSLKNPMAYHLSERGLNLPSALNLTDAQLDYACTRLEEILDADLAQSSFNTRKAA